MENQQGTDSGQVKILFTLEQDEDGYPPISVESVWARKTPDNFYEIDNISFYVRGISYKDVVNAERDDEGALYFKSVVRRAGHSTVRVIVSDLKDRDDLQKKLEDFGCSWEGSNQPSLIAVDIPPEVKLASVLQFLQHGFEQERWDYEEAFIAE